MAHLARVGYEDDEGGPQKGGFVKCKCSTPSEKEHAVGLMVNKIAEGIDEVQEGKYGGNENSGDVDGPL